MTKEIGTLKDKCGLCDGTGIIDKYSTWEASCPNCVGRDTPKTWGDMTDEEKGALLLAKHEGKVIEVYESGEWTKPLNMIWYDWHAYRVKPEPVREVVTLHNDPYGGWSFYEDSGTYRRSHRITFETVDGKPDCDSIKMEEIVG